MLVICLTNMWRKQSYETCNGYFGGVGLWFWYTQLDNTFIYISPLLLTMFVPKRGIKISLNDFIHIPYMFTLYIFFSHVLYDCLLHVHRIQIAYASHIQLYVRKCALVTVMTTEWWFKLLNSIFRAISVSFFLRGAESLKWKQFAVYCV